MHIIVAGNNWLKYFRVQRENRTVWVFTESLVKWSKCLLCLQTIEFEYETAEWTWSALHTLTVHTHSAADVCSLVWCRSGKHKLFMKLLWVHRLCLIFFWSFCCRPLGLSEVFRRGRNSQKQQTHTANIGILEDPLQTFELLASSRSSLQLWFVSYLRFVLTK